VRWLVVFLVGCSAAREAPPRADALAQVNGQVITPAEVEALARTTGLPPRELLHDLVSERLLVDHAAAYERTPEVQRGVERALVQRLLAIEIAPGDPPEAQRAKLEQLLARLRTQTPVQYREEAIGRAFAPPP
jgi:hypothetical protein